MFFGYNTNGFANHALLDAIEVIADLGYEGVAITIDHHALDPWDADFLDELQVVERSLFKHNLRSVIETGARFLLDPRRKHEPTLLAESDDAQWQRVTFLHEAIDTAAAIGSDCVSLWAGVLPSGMSEEAGWRRLIAGMEPVLRHAEKRGVTLGFEPEPGMLVATMADYDRLIDFFASEQLKLTLDIGHLHCLGEIPITSVISRYADQLVNVHIEDMRAGEHEHLMFGEGEIDFPPVLRSLRECGYKHGAYVELSRHSHLAPVAARRAINFLQGAAERL